MNSWTLLGFRVSPHRHRQWQRRAYYFTEAARQVSLFAFIIYTKPNKKKTHCILSLQGRIALRSSKILRHQPQNPEIVHDNFFCIIFLCTVLLLEILSLSLEPSFFFNIYTNKKLPFSFPFECWSVCNEIYIHFVSNNIYPS